MTPALAPILAALTLALAQPEPAPPLPPPTSPRELAPEDRPDAERIDAPEEPVSEAVRARVTADFLTEDERADLRVLHGLWTPEDLKDPARNAAATLTVHAWDHPALRDPGAPALDRAEALLNAGDPGAALDLLDASVRAERLRGDALRELGRADEAADAYGRAVAGTDNEPESVRAALALLRLRAPRDPEAHARALYARIAAARDADRLDYRPRVVEGELLYARHNRGDAVAAAKDALRLNPRCVAALRILGDVAVDAFDFDTADAVADRIDALASGGARRPQVTADGAAIRARVALRRRDPDDAEHALDPAMARMPDQRELRALEAAAAAAAYRTASTDRLLADFDALSPASPDALLWVGSILSEARQYDLADDYLQRAIQRAPAWSLPRLERGLMLVQAGRDDDARAELERATALDPFDIRAQNSLTLVTELATYAVLETDHFIVRHKPGIDDALAPEIAATMERIHARVCSDAPGGVDFEPKQKTIIELMPNHEWFAVRIGGMPSIHTMAASTGPVIAIESPQEGPRFTVGPFDWPRVLQHEYTHTVNLARTRNRIIHWMTEANAVFNEDAPRDARTWRLLAGAYESGGLFDLEGINIAFVRPKQPSDRALAYAQGAWMFEYIVDRWGPVAPRTIMDLSASGRTPQEAFEEALSESPDSFLASFKAWAKDQLTAQGLLLPEGTPDMLAILADLAPDTKRGEAALPEPALLDKALARYPDHPQLLELRAGVALVNAGERLSDDQVALLSRLIAAEPFDDMPHKRLARHHLAGDTFAERLRAIPHLEFLDAREISSPAYAAELAELYARTDRPALALAKAERAASIAPFDATRREQAARMAILAGDLDAAERHLIALTIIEPDRDVHRRRLEALQRKRAAAP